MGKKVVIDEETIVNIIVSAGEAYSMMQQAFMEECEGNEKGANELLEKADEALYRAHHAQTELLQAEASGDEAEMSLLMVHAQDHLMNAILCKNLIRNQIQMQKQINELKEGK